MMLQPVFPLNRAGCVLNFMNAAVAPTLFPFISVNIHFGAVSALL